jgi:tripartite-type tricarboxylate transporter receptor subunit TctC
MLNMRHIGCALAAVAIAVFSMPGRAPAQEPPPVVKIMVGSVAGGILDPYARIVGEHMSKTLGRTVIVENKPGANGTISAQYVVDQPADGTWMWVGTQAMTEINPSAYKICAGGSTISSRS